MCRRYQSNCGNAPSARPAEWLWLLIVVGDWQPNGKRRCSEKMSRSCSRHWQMFTISCDTDSIRTFWPVIADLYRDLVALDREFESLECNLDAEIRLRDDQLRLCWKTLNWDGFKFAWR